MFKNNSFSNTPALEMPLYTPTLVYIVEILNYENLDPRTKIGAPVMVQSLRQIICSKMFIFLSKHHCLRNANIYTEACSYSEDSKP